MKGKENVVEDRMNVLEDLVAEQAATIDSLKSELKSVAANSTNTSVVVKTKPKVKPSDIVFEDGKKTWKARFVRFQVPDKVGNLQEINLSDIKGDTKKLAATLKEYPHAFAEVK